MIDTVEIAMLAAESYQQRNHHHQIVVVAVPEEENSSPHKKEIQKSKSDMSSNTSTRGEQFRKQGKNDIIINALCYCSNLLKFNKN